LSHYIDLVLIVKDHYSFDMMRSCPGAAWAKNPTITEKICPRCGREIELFSIDPYMPCECGFIAYNDVQSCMKWCAYARQCVGDEVYDKFMANQGEKIKAGSKNE